MSNIRRTMKRKSVKAKEPVRMRFKELANGNKSIYLDIYKDGKREYEFLKLYLIPESDLSTRMQNEETLRTANAIKAQRIISLQNEQHGFSNAGVEGRKRFIKYLEEQAENYEKKGSKAYARSVRNAIVQLIRYKGESIQIRQVDKKYLLGYIDYLDSEASKYFEGGAKGTTRKRLSESSKALYWGVVVTALNRAVKDGILQSNPAHKIHSEDKPKGREQRTIYLTLDEVGKLAETPCQYPELKKAFLFSCFCGLRMSDIRNLKWGAIGKMSDGSKQVEMIQQKTKTPIYVPLSDNALDWLPDKGRKGANDKVFDLPHVSTIEKWLAKWAEDAGVNKHITFHISRHTFATLGLTYGADIYTISKLVGHSRIQTTERYAKVIDENKRKAVNLIPKLKK